MQTFNDLGLNEALVTAVTELGFEQPTPVQAQAIPTLLANSIDLVALAQTGTGKTAAFGLPLLNQIESGMRKPQGLILCPTRELCIQISRDLQSYARHMPAVKVVSVYGGASIENQMRDLKDGAQIIVATPGRMVDIIERNKVDLTGVSVAILDEADEMLNMGFKEDLDFILSYTPETKQTWLFSATMPAEVARIAKTYMDSPVEITLGNKNSGNENIEHIYYTVSVKDKYPALKRIADSEPSIFAIVFCRTKRETQQVADALIRDGYPADALHGDLSQAQRDLVMKRYRNRNLQMLVATDVAARGIDVENVTHVINFNLPDELENYTHRSGRTARAGKKGISIALVTRNEKGKIKSLERALRATFTEGQVPTSETVFKNRLKAFSKSLMQTEALPEVEPFMEDFSHSLQSLTREDLLKVLLSREFSSMLEYYKSGPVIDETMHVEGGKDVARFFVNLGSMDGLNPREMRTFLAQTAGIRESDIPWMGLKNSFTLLEVSSHSAEIFKTAFKGCFYNERPVRVEVRNSSESGGGARKGGRRESGGSGGGFKRRKKVAAY
jgi:ATP-dependent RNA helicase DeaD